MVNVFLFHNRKVGRRTPTEQGRNSAVGLLRKSADGHRKGRIGTTGTAIVALLRDVALAEQIKQGGVITAPFYLLVTALYACWCLTGRDCSQAVHFRCGLTPNYIDANFKISNAFFSIGCPRCYRKFSTKCAIIS